MSNEKYGYDDGRSPQDPPPGYRDQYPPQYPAPQYMDHPAFPPGGYTQGNVLVAPGAQTMYEPPPPDQMTKAIFVTICCFWPTGIFAIMKASEARSAAARGDMGSARSYSNAARQLSNISIMAGVASILILIVIMGIYIGVIMKMRT